MKKVLLILSVILLNSCKSTKGVIKTGKQNGLGQEVWVYSKKDSPYIYIKVKN